MYVCMYICMCVYMHACIVADYFLESQIGFTIKSNKNINNFFLGM